MDQLNKLRIQIEAEQKALNDRLRDYEFKMADLNVR